MKYMCMECRKIWKLRSAAAECCQPTVLALQEDNVIPCTHSGEACEDEDCSSCQGTGWQWRSVEAYKKVTGA